MVEAVSTALSDLDLDDNVGYVNWESLQVGPIRGATIEEVDRSAGSVSSSVTLELIFYGVIVANIDSVRILLRHQRNCSVAALSLPETPFPHFFSAGALGEDLVIPADASEQKLDETVVILAERIMAEIGTTADICYPYSR